MLQIALCDDNINELSNMIQLITLYKSSKNFNFEYAVFTNGIELISVLESYSVNAINYVLKYDCAGKSTRNQAKIS